ncbi:hypothetical protein [Rhodoferax sp.]|uniref:hypothetical protein n=1 Tax=Rhodoferax sp. TaxID=50421 RepID=UPI0027533FBF|nr:hypothetical protein [Rhodoferax sp.]
MNPTIAARLFGALIGATVAFQLALALGAPWGHLAWGGAYAGALPTTMRLASLASVTLLLALAAVVLIRAGMTGLRWKPASTKLVWLVVAYCGLGVIANAMSPSFWERVIWVPVTLTLLACSLVVARSR